MTLTVATWNVNGIRARAEQVERWLAEEHPDVFCLQEIKAKPEQVTAQLAELADYWTVWHGAGGYSGVCLGVRRSLVERPPEFAHPEFDFETRMATAEIGDFVVASVYVPNGGKDFDAKLRFLAALRDWARDLHAQSKTLILCGDLNVALEERDIHPKERKAGQIGARPEERALLGELLAQGLVDVGRALDPGNDALYTWWPPWRQMRERNIGWRIDYVLASTPLAESSRSCRVMAKFGTSDHAPVLASFAR